MRSWAPQSSAGPPAGSIPRDSRLDPALPAHPSSSRTPEQGLRQLLSGPKRRKEPFSWLDFFPSHGLIDSLEHLRDYFIKQIQTRLFIRSHYCEKGMISWEKIYLIWREKTIDFKSFL